MFTRKQYAMIAIMPTLFIICTVMIFMLPALTSLSYYDYGKYQAIAIAIDIVVFQAALYGVFGLVYSFIP